jgi:hypothetical protein
MRLFESSLFLIKEDYQTKSICETLNIDLRNQLFVYISMTQVDNIFGDQAELMKESAD